jgi:hypothetical protein
LSKMKDCFNLNAINRDLLDIIGDCVSMASVCEEYVVKLDRESGEEIVKNIENIEKNVLKVKKNIVRMVNELESKEEIIEVKNVKKGFMLE